MNHITHPREIASHMSQRKTSDPARRGPMAPRLLLMPFLIASLSLASCGDGTPEDVYEAPMVDLQQRNFKGPGQIAQGLGPDGRAVVFIILESLDPNETVEYDADWTFEITVKGPDGSDEKVDLDPSVPRSWSNDPGVRMIAGFDSVAKGTHQVTVTSPNCPRGMASMVVLPIN